MTIIVTGSAGCIGSNFCNWLIDNTEHEVVGIDNLSTGYKENMPRDARFIFCQADVLDEKYIANLFAIHEPKVCFHFASYAAEGRSNYIRSFIHSNNTVGAANIINCCINFDCKLIFTSSVAVYSGAPPYSEETIPCPIDEYGLSKCTTEKSIQIAGEQHGLDWCIIRPRNVYGVRQSLWDTARNLWGIWFYQYLNEQPLTVFGDGSNRRAFTYIDDILEPLYKAIDVSKQVVNLGAEKSYSIKEAAEIFCEVTGYDKIIHLEPRHEVSIATCLTEKSKQLLGFKEKTTIYKGVKKMHEWAIIQPRRKQETPPKLEVRKNLHSSII